MAININEDFINGKNPLIIVGLSGSGKSTLGSLPDHTVPVANPTVDYTVSPYVPPKGNGRKIAEKYNIPLLI